jgi:CRP-like cAMP-binding protein
MHPKTDGNGSVVGRAFETRGSFNASAFGARYGGVSSVTLKSGAVLFHQGETADALYYLEHGQVRISVVSDEGQEGILGVLDSGSFCGEGCLLAGRLRVATATCLTDCVVARLEGANVIFAIREDPAIAEFFLIFALTGVARLRENLISQLFESCERRLVRVLLTLARCGADGCDDRPRSIRDLDQEALAQMIGTTRPRVNLFMNKFRKLGWIDYDNDKILVRRSLLDAVPHDDRPNLVENPMQLSARAAGN